MFRLMILLICVWISQVSPNLLRRCDGEDPTVEGVVTNPNPMPSENCDRLLRVARELESYMEQIVFHIVNETTILDNRMHQPDLLSVLRSITPEEAVFSAFADIIPGGSERVKQFIRQQLCRIADAKSIEDIHVVQGEFKPYNIPPNARKSILGYMFLQTRVIKEIFDSGLDILADSGYSNFPLHIDQKTLTTALRAYLDAVTELGSTYAKVREEYTDVPAVVTEQGWKVYAKTEKLYFGLLLQARSMEELLTRYTEASQAYNLMLMDENKVAFLTDVLFDIVENRHLYLPIVDIFGNFVITITEIGLLDLPTKGDTTPNL